jgi:hypothetical protein
MSNPLQDVKIINMIPPVAIKDNTSWTTTEIDTLGYDYALAIVNLGATDIAMAALKMQESNTPGSNYGDVTGLVFGTSTDALSGSTSALPTAAQDDKVFAFQIDLRGRKRYLDLVATAGNGTVGTYLSGVCILWRGDNAPRTATETNITGLLRV